jgi:monofunctional biosynthetic peptidoglycan transglycosylase
MARFRFPSWRLWRKIGRGALVAAALAFGYLAYNYITLPDVRLLAGQNPTTTAFMELRARQARARGGEPRRLQRWVPYDQISPDLMSAVLVAEDDAFWQHEGVDFEQLQQSLRIDWARGRMIRGASTITQQLAKNLYLSPSRNPMRKARELVIARRLEAELSKARILELYLNVIEWGDGIYGAEAAARTYFHVSAADLGPSEAALLAGAIINPRVLSPAHPSQRLVRRQQIILRRMKVAPKKDELDVPPREEPETPGDDLSEPEETAPLSLISPGGVLRIQTNSV